MTEVLLTYLIQITVCPLAFILAWDLFKDLSR